MTDVKDLTKSSLVNCVSVTKLGWTCTTFVMHYHPAGSTMNLVVMILHPLISIQILSQKKKENGRWERWDSHKVPQAAILLELPVKDMRRLIISP
jgi:hypothetical protein